MVAKSFQKVQNDVMEISIRGQSDLSHKARTASTLILNDSKTTHFLYPSCEFIYEEIFNIDDLDVV